MFHIKYRFSRLQTSRARGGRKRLRGNAGGPILLGVKHAEVPADDLVGRIALDVFRASVPSGDYAVLVELEDRIVDH